jgi:hypothetical protein
MGRPTTAPLGLWCVVLHRCVDKIRRPARLSSDEYLFDDRQIALVLVRSLRAAAVALRFRVVVPRPARLPVPPRALCALNSTLALGHHDPLLKHTNLM